MIETIELSKRYEDGVLALDRLDMEVDAGEVFCLLGANGAGKTTTINILLNFIEPTSGTARIHGVDVVESSLEARRHVAYLSENVKLYGNFTARQNVDFFARLGGREDLTQDEIYDTLRRVGLPERAFEQRVGKFSKGMRQKLGIALAILKDTPAMILDEPMSGLDPKAAAELVEILDDLRTQGKAILLSTHDIFRAKELADRVAILKDGRKLVECTRDQLEHEDLEALYLAYMQGDAREVAAPESPREVA